MEKKALLTVIIPVYNGESFIRQTVDRIITSAWKDLEIVLVDDGSTDNSAQICRFLQEEDKRIHCIFSENGGIAAARNKGLEAATGKYVCFCDQDDETLPDMYENILTKMEQESADMGMCSTGRNIDGTRSLFESLKDGCYKDAEIRSHLLYPLLFRGYDYPFINEGHYFYGSIWKCIFRREMVKKAGLAFRCFIDFEDDWLFTTQALTEAKTVVTVSKIGYYWNVHKTSRSHTHRYIEDLPERLQRMDVWVDGYLGRGLPEHIFKEYRKVRQCEHYVRLLENGLPEGSRSERKRCREETKRYILQSEYHEQLSVMKHLRKNAFGKRLVLGSLKYLGVGAAFHTAPVFNRLIQSAEKLSWVVSLERKSKTGEKEIER